ncbi:MAG TPA: ATPase, T2SS/T4P/T4SS family [Candidatus Binataceae bacterium]|nr:ATPase, T2SS/T4P/T4SS family [Candidatus Binataceae bacterium]
MQLYSTKRELDTVVAELFGATVAELLSDRAMQEVAGNYVAALDAVRVFADYGAGPMRDTGATIPAVAIEAASRLLASDVNKVLDPAVPFLNRVLASGFRYHYAGYPVSDGARFSIRTLHRILRLLSDFMTVEEERLIRNAILANKTILVGGGTSSGKTTLLNAMIAAIPVEERLMILEDEPELQVREGNVMRGQATAKADLGRHVFETLRDRPDRIIVGEVRGPEAYAMLDAFSTGHTGFATMHANGAAEVLTRLARLAQCDQQLISEAIDLVIYVERQPDGRRIVTQIRELTKPGTGMKPAPTQEGK